MAEIIKDKELITSLIEQVIEHEGTGDKIYNYYANVCRLVPDKVIIVDDFTELFYPIYYQKVADDLNLHLYDFEKDSLVDPTTVQCGMPILTINIIYSGEGFKDDFYISFFNLPIL